MAWRILEPGPEVAATANERLAACPTYACHPGRSAE